MTDAHAYIVFAPDGEFPPQRLCENWTHAVELARRFMAATGETWWNIYPLVPGSPVRVEGDTK